MTAAAQPAPAHAGLAGERMAGLLGPGLAGLIVYALVLATPAILTDGDTYWHIAAGEWMLEHRQVLHSDVFSYTHAGKPWVTHEWLVEVVMALAYRGGGWSGIVLLTAAAAGGTAMIVAAWLRRWLTPVPLAAVLTVGLSLLAFNMLARPHVLVLPVLAGWAVGLLSARAADKAPSVWLLPLMLIWANIHGSFVFGLALIGPFALEALLAERQRPWPVVRAWGGFGLAALATSLVTPHGIDGFIYPFQLVQVEAVNHIGEWQSPDFSVIQPLEVALLAALGVGLSGRVKLPLLRILVLLALVHMTLQHARHQMVLGLLAALIIGQALGAARSAAPAGRNAAAALASIVLVAFVAAGARLAVPIERGDEFMTPKSALASVPAELQSKPVFNEYGWGGYLIFEGVKPFIDGRSDMYGDPLFADYLAVGNGDAREMTAVLDRYGVAWTILRPDRRAVSTLDGLPGWRRLYADETAVVHVRTAPARLALRGLAH